MEVWYKVHGNDNEVDISMNILYTNPANTCVLLMRCV